MKTIEHGKLMSVCRHSGETWYVALAGVLVCTEANASAPDMEAIVEEMQAGKGVWHRGFLLTPGR